MSQYSSPVIITLYKVGKDGALQFYTVHDRQNTLDAPYALCTAWRVGSGKERERLHRFATLADKDTMTRRIVAARLKDGYKVLYSFLRSGVSVGLDPARGSPSSEGIPLTGSIEGTA